MAGMAEMAQMAAILKYKRYAQECRQLNDKDLVANSIAKKDRRLDKCGKENCAKNWQGRWRDMKENFGSRTEKGLNKKLL